MVEPSVTGLTSSVPDPAQVVDWAVVASRAVASWRRVSVRVRFVLIPKLNHDLANLTIVRPACYDVDTALRVGTARVEASSVSSGSGAQHLQHGGPPTERSDPCSNQ